jgi:hypothetical protein
MLKRALLVRSGLFVVFLSTAGCGAKSGTPAGAAGASSTTASSASTPAATASAAPAKAERPIATTGAEATSLIDEALTGRQKELGHCVTEARARRKNTHAEVVLEIGIDQEGHLIGVKSPKGTAPDPALQECVIAVLKDAPFPRSKAGVITVRKNFTDQVFYP